MLSEKDLIDYIRLKLPDLKFDSLANTPDLTYILDNEIHGYRTKELDKFIRWKYIKLDDYVSSIDKLTYLAPKITNILPTTYILTDDLYRIAANIRNNKLKKALK